jgi:hypothetical protein
VERSGQQQPSQQCQQHQQQPSDGATHGHLESAYAGCSPNTQPSVAKPVSSPVAATTTTTTSVQTWRILEDSPYHFLAISHLATILFDSVASHSFITSSFVAKHSLSIANMKHTMLVSSPGGEMRTKHICPAISISIRGVDFPSNLILLDSKGIDITLGMDQLSKYDGVI